MLERHHTKQARVKTRALVLRAHKISSDLVPQL
jgi:hypothetical protein